MQLICSVLFNFAPEYKSKNLTEEVNQFAASIWGENWLNMSQKGAYQNILKPSAS
jgi:hypothetical protein